MWTQTFLVSDCWFIGAPDHGPIAYYFCPLGVTYMKYLTRSKLHLAQAILDIASENQSAKCVKHGVAADDVLQMI